MIDRRGLFAGAASAILAVNAHAEPDPRLFVTGALARNDLATSFHRPPEPLVLPGTRLIGAQGPQMLADLRGRTCLISLWAEWCAPCLMEAGDLASLAQTYAGPGFAVVFVLTGSTHKLDFPAARAVLAKYGAGGGPLLVEPDGQNAVMRALATSRLDPKLQALMKSETGQSLPCNLLVDRGGRIRGRSFGAKSAGSGPAPHQGPMTETDKAKLLTQHSKWATPAGGEFIAALAAGALEKA